MRRLNKRWMFVGFGIMALALAVGIGAGLATPFPELHLPERDVHASITIMQSIRGEYTFRVIFTNNTRVFLMLTVGILTGGLLSLAEMLLIGYFIGILSQISSQQGTPLVVTLAALLPHGIPELAAFATVGALGVHLGFRVYMAARGQHTDWWQEVRTYGKVVIVAYVVLVLAALIEAYISPSLVAYFMRVTAQSP
ncbi:MAG: stage II sporulation protein M [Blastocatellia bacterium]|nr:stage II sporulation protein M [Blastocatellia bacterium]MCS7158124.1 stage II sporulation protein M [Blastocatellia bacterium]MCX7753013.1 stage II sporulation protein M [Blastocatellia bacterium]MDW8168536.1 stage II sporulation protein M [Acidobacteriota bacterium]MDW8256950.1 stage II sporulation protein M [Acidobacteriota bacterium]